jgi:hypothetical protein
MPEGIIIQWEILIGGDVHLLVAAGGVIRYGISLILINVGMYVVIPTIILVKIRKKL